MHDQNAQGLRHRTLHRVDDLPTQTSSVGSAEANRRFYETHAAIYDETEFCAEELARAKLEETLEEALALLPPDPAVLDAGGGTGNASMLLRRAGTGSTLIDASPEMIARWRAKAEAAGFEHDSELADLESFFEHDARTWDLIVFSSVLHHLDDPARVLVEATRTLRPGGVIVTVFDPLRVDRLGLFLRRLDYACWIAMHSPSTLLRALWRRLTGRLRGGSPEPNFGELAERHAMSGLDDADILRRMESAGARPVKHERIADARYEWITAASRRLDQATHFSFIFRLGGEQP